jgi:hypothetical protein
MSEEKTYQTSMLLPGDSPARISVSREPDGMAVCEASTANAVDYGGSLPDSFARFDPDTSSWRTFQPSLVPPGEAENSDQRPLDLFSDSWPRAGMLRDGKVYQLPPSVPRIVATGSLSLPTIGASEWKGVPYKRFRGSPHSRSGRMSEGLRTCETDPIYLHPSFGELAMGFPIGWSDLEDSETPSTPQ